jgi:hypothetical protein
MERKPFSDRFTALQMEADSWKSAWKDIRDYICPTRGFFDEQPNQGKKIDHTRIVNSSAARSLNVLASGMTSGLTSPSRPWFRLGLHDSDLADFEPVKVWLATAQDRMMSVYQQSNIYGALNTGYQEIGSFGTSAMLLLEDFKDVIRARSFTCGEYFLGMGPDNRVDSFARGYHMTVGQLIKDFGADRVSQTVRMAWENGKRDQWVRVRHLIQPNDRKIDGAIGFEGKAFISCYWEESSQTDTFLRCSGFDDFPVLAPRWTTTTTADVYGRSPGWEALGDVKMLQKMEKDKLLALDKVVDPPVLRDATIGEGEVNTLPGGVTVTSSSTQNSGLRAIYQLNPDFNAIEQSIQKTEGRIDKAFFADLFMMIAMSSSSNMTAREVVERHEEKLLMLGPVLERLESELLDPLIDRTFNIMLKNGLLPEAPKELQGMSLKVEYVSMLAQAQKMVGTTAIEQLFRFTGNIAAVVPDVIDNLDSDAAVYEYGEMLGVPPNIVRSYEEVASMRQQKQQAAAQAQADQQSAQTGAAVVSGAKTLADTKLGQNSALDALMAGFSDGTTASGVA